MAASWTVLPAEGALLEEVAAIEAATFGPSPWGCLLYTSRCV
ncbi:hypothetical protein [Bittarella massiliensis (ex Durand et al. 2017)]|nr:hypothetical protein [Bittarella massiliensis (ex Durand et al. 2017)]